MFLKDTVHASTKTCHHWNKQQITRDSIYEVYIYHEKTYMSSVRENVLTL